MTGVIIRYSNSLSSILQRVHVDLPHSCHHNYALDGAHMNVLLPKSALIVLQAEAPKSQSFSGEPTISLPIIKLVARVVEEPGEMKSALEQAHLPKEHSVRRLQIRARFWLVRVPTSFDDVSNVQTRSL